MVRSLRVAERGADDEGQDDWVSPALPPLAMIKQVKRIEGTKDGLKTCLLACLDQSMYLPRRYLVHPHMRTSVLLAYRSDRGMMERIVPCR